MIDIPIEAVEAAARAWASGSPTPNNWENMTERMRDTIRARMRDAFAAALPHLVPEGMQPGCTGAHGCPAPAHLHGCYADTGNCSDPHDHDIPQHVSPSVGDIAQAIFGTPIGRPLTIEQIDALTASVCALLGPRANPTADQMADVIVEWLKSYDDTDDDRYQASRLTDRVLALLSSQPTVEQVRREALLSAADDLAKRASVLFRAADRLWRMSQYGRDDDPESGHRPGQTALDAASRAGQMERDADRLRARAAEAGEGRG